MGARGRRVRRGGYVDLGFTSAFAQWHPPAPRPLPTAAVRARSAILEIAKSGQLWLIRRRIVGEKKLKIARLNLIASWVVNRVIKNDIFATAARFYKRLSGFVSLTSMHDMVNILLICLLYVH